MLDLQKPAIIKRRFADQYKFWYPYCHNWIRSTLRHINQYYEDIGKEFIRWDYYKFVNAADFISDQLGNVEILYVDLSKAIYEIKLTSSYSSKHETIAFAKYLSGKAHNAKTTNPAFTMRNYGNI